MRGLEPEDIAADPMSGITMADLEPYRFPTDEEIAEVGVRGIYITNFLYWDEKAHGELVIDTYGFAPMAGPRDRTFKLFATIISDAKGQKGLDGRENYSCRQGTPAPPDDPHYTIRAWRGVVTYLLRRHEFLYE